MATKQITRINRKKISSSSRSSGPTRPTRRRLTLRERRARTRLIITLVSFVLVIGAGIGVSRLSFSPAVSLNAISVRGNSLISTDELLALIKEQTASAYLGVFSKNNSVLFPRGAVEEKITDTYKTITRANISFNGLHTATLVVEERKPSALWCAGDAPAGTGDCFYMDQTGYVFDKAPQFNGAVYVAYFGGASGAQAGEQSREPIGTQFLPPADFKKLTDFVTDVSRFGVKPVSVTVEQNGDGLIRLLSGGNILFSRTLDYNQTLENLQSIITSEQAKTRGTFLKRLDYVNVRFNGKAFFKLKPEN